MYIILHRDAGFSRGKWLYTKCFNNRIEDRKDDTMHQGGSVCDKQK